ncbi:MAG: InlB B-repeat-containing protein, partial [Syntrophomonadaceae bacterium]|nr:InlB B-repeat-containing protein [Syntrophomonadaceae bacterium]
FTYNPATNTLAVSPGKDAFIEEGEMIITWAGAPLAFTSAPLSRTFKLHWDNLKNGYAIIFETNGGSAVPMIFAPYHTPITPPDPPTKAGYDFAGWYTDNNFATPYVFPATMPNTDTIVYAKWVPRNDTPYTVEHYQQNLANNLYTIVESDTERLSGTTDSVVIPQPKVYEGFDTPAAQSLTILADGNGIVRYYYPRKTYTVTFDPGEAGGQPIVYQYKFGQTITPPHMNNVGFTFVAWDKAVPETMPAQNLTFIAQWSPAEGTPYRVEHYIQNTAATGYTLSQIEPKIGQTNQELKLEDFALTLDGISFEKSTVDGQIVENAKIKGNGTLVVKLYYTRNEYKLTWQINNGETSEETYRFGQDIILPVVPTQAGYTFSGWKSNPELTQAFNLTNMPSRNITAYGEYIANSNTPYRVEHYQQNMSLSGYTLVEADNLTGVTDRPTEAVAKNYTGFTPKAFEQGTIAGDGKTVIRIEYDRNIYDVNLDTAGGTINSGNVTSYIYGIGAQLPTDITRAGYIFNGWFDGAVKVTNISATDTGDKNYTAHWTPSNNTPYTIKHLREDLNGQYTIEEMEIKYGTTDTDTSALKRDYTGFTAQNFKQSKIAGNGSTVVEIRYDRNSYRLFWHLENGSLGGNYTSGNVKFGQTITPPNAEKDGYTFSGWYQDPELQNPFIIPLAMPAEDIDVYGRLTANSGIAYKVQHYLENADDDGYTLYETENYTGYTDEEVTATQKDYDYCYFNGDAPGTLLSGKIKADGSLALKLYYDRETFTVDYLVDGEPYGEQALYKYGATIVYPANPEKEGYNFDAWLLDGESFTGTMPGRNIILTVAWSAGEKSYTIRYFQERLEYTNENNRWELITDDSTV